MFLTGESSPKTTPLQTAGVDDDGNEDVDDDGNDDVADDGSTYHAPSKRMTKKKCCRCSCFNAS